MGIPHKPLRDAKGHYLKGERGNPGGRSPSAAALTHAYRDKLDTVCLDDPKHRTYAELIADKMVELALAGNVQAASEITDRVEGKARQSVNVQQSPVIDVDAARERLYAAMLEAEGKDTPTQ